MINKKYIFFYFSSSFFTQVQAQEEPTFVDMLCF